MNHDFRRAALAADVWRSVLGDATAAARSAIVSWGCRVAAVGLIAASGSAAIAAPLFFSGRLDNPNNTALVGSDLGPAQFGSQLDVANNVALHAFTITTAGTYDLTSTGVAVGGVDPYVTIFSGLGAGATFFESNFVNAFSVGGDFTLSLLLAAGDYTLAVGAFANMSFAENLGFGTLGDGFTGLGSPASLADGPYEITIDVGTEPQPVPEPPLTALCLAALAAMAAVRGRLARSRSAAGAPTSTRSWLAPITAAVLALAAGPVFAQRAALVQNVDDSLRNPYQERQTVFCNLFCQLAFSPVPAGRRRVVEYASCRTTVPEGSVLEVILANLGPAAFVYLPLQRSPATSQVYFANGATQLFFEAGEAPSVTSGALSPGRISFLQCTLTGREITLH